MRRTFPRRAGAMLPFLCLLLLGCGAEYYETRLAATVEQFRYYEELNQNLSPRAWSEAGVQLRPPKAFTEIPGPPPAPPAEKEEGEQSEASPPETEPDPRQPDFLADDITLPGLVGAWTADVRVGKDKTVPAYFYVLSNYDLWTQPDQQKLATRFHDEVVQRLREGLGASIRQEHWRTVKFPSGESYVDKRQYTAATLDPKPRIHDVPTDVSIYLQKAKDTQAVFLSVIPEGADPRLKEQVAHALETVKLTASKPRTGQQKRQSGAGTAF